MVAAMRPPWVHLLTECRAGTSSSAAQQRCADMRRDAPWGSSLPRACLASQLRR